MTGTWLITGAAGFIGSNLCEYLLEKNQNVIGVDNLSTGRQSNLERLYGSKMGDFLFFIYDIRKELDPHIFDTNIDHVVHLAAQVSVQKSIDNPKETYFINEIGFRNVAQLVEEVSASAFVYASSCAVYGDNPNLPLDERSALHPLSPYAHSKLQNELDGHEICRKIPSLSVVGLRFFNIFGPWQDSKGGYAAVISKWIQCLMSGSQPIMYGDGLAQRDYCYVMNVCDAIWLAATAKQSSEFHWFMMLVMNLVIINIYSCYNRIMLLLLT